MTTESRSPPRGTARGRRRDRRAPRPRPAIERRARRAVRAHAARRIRQRWLYGTAGGLVALVFGAWVLWAGLDQASGNIDATDRAFDIVDDRTIDVTFSVVMPAGTEAFCAVQAQDEQRSIVGWKVVELPAQDGFERMETVRLRTTGPAVTGLIHSCWPA